MGPLSGPQGGKDERRPGNRAALVVWKKPVTRDDARLRCRPGQRRAGFGHKTVANRKATTIVRAAGSRNSRQIGQAMWALLLNNDTP